MKCKKCEKEFEFTLYVPYILIEWAELRGAGGGWESHDHSSNAGNPSYYPACPFCSQPLYRGAVHRWYERDGTFVAERPEDE